MRPSRMQNKNTWTTFQKAKESSSCYFGFRWCWQCQPNNLGDSDWSIGRQKTSSISTKMLEKIRALIYYRQLQTWIHQVVFCDYKRHNVNKKYIKRTQSQTAQVFMKRQAINPLKFIFITKPSDSVHTIGTDSKAVFITVSKCRIT